MRRRRRKKKKKPIGRKLILEGSWKVVEREKVKMKLNKKKQTRTETHISTYKIDLERQTEQ